MATAVFKREMLVIFVVDATAREAANLWRKLVGVIGDLDPLSLGLAGPLAFS